MIVHRNYTDAFWDAACEIYPEYIAVDTTFELWQLGAGPYCLMPACVTPPSEKAKLCMIGRITHQNFKGVPVGRGTWDLQRVGSVDAELMKVLEGCE